MIGGNIKIPSVGKCRILYILKQVVQVLTTALHIIRSIIYVVYIRVRIRHGLQYNSFLQKFCVGQISRVKLQ